ncbi:bacterial transcriptional activator domain-containing protein, partial [Actinomadura fulvescens]
HVPAPRPTEELGGGAGTGGATVPGQHQEDQAPLPFDLEWPHGLAAASLLAAGLLSALGRRRRTQLWHRAFGQMIARPEGRAAKAEQALRVGADPAAVELLDLGLRQLSRAMAAEGGGQGRAMPTVYGVHLGKESLDLWIAPADRNPPAPWEAYDDGQVWRLRGDATTGLRAAELGDVLAPYPGLVSIGTNENGRILVDLEAAHGLIALQGPVETRRAVLAALALELATNRWSDHMRITLVGFGAELGEGLADIAPDRVRTVASLDQALPELEGRSEEVRQALAASGVDSVLTGRCRGVFGEAWMPHYLIMADQPTEREADRLVALARTGTRMAAGYIVPGEVQGATWTWEVDADARLQAGVLGFQVDAQLIPEEHYRGVFELFRTARRLDSVPLADPSDIAGAEPPGTRQSSVDIRLLGPIEVDAPGPMDESRRALCTEVLVYLATHPGGVHPTVLSGAIWPRGVTTGVRDACVARVSDWLGRDARGRPNLYYDDRGRIRLGSEVRVDWAVFRWLVWRSAAEPSSETAYMSYALDLVRGPVLADRPRGRYGWLASDDLEYEASARVIDVAHRLVVLRLEEGDARGAVGAARAGLRLAPEDEGLWRDLLRATHATGDEAQVQVVVDELRYRVARDPLLDQLQPETEALMEELLPQWHQVSAR